ncbi:hypothetical protein HUU05_05585 [candidate division KSB1 bacterium]|nr:hypothetical protein [candidate division KSB1 bacterium]
MKTISLKCGQLVLAGLVGMFAFGDLAHAGEEDGLIKIRLSYKIIRNPKNLARPNPTTKYGESITNAMVEAAVDEMNALLADSWRGYRFELYEVVEIGSRGGFDPDPAFWFATDFVEGDRNNELLDQMIAHVARYPELYAWRKNAVNLYVNQGTSGAKWRIKNFKDVIWVGADSLSAGWLQLHEIGHYFGLQHTHGDLGIALRDHKGIQKAPGDDRITDTIADLASWNRDEIAEFNFSLRYEALNAAQKELVEDIATNIMSYHFLPPLHANLQRLTEKQLDRWADIAVDFYRRPVCDGRVWFVDVETPGYEGTSTYPFDTVKRAVEAANLEGGDVILLRAGAYDEKLTITKPVTLRVTRQGPATIGAAAISSEPSWH